MSIRVVNEMLYHYHMITQYYIMLFYSSHIIFTETLPTTVDLLFMRFLFCVLFLPCLNYNFVEFSRSGTCIDLFSRSGRCIDLFSGSGTCIGLFYIILFTNKHLHMKITSVSHCVS